VHGFWLAAAIQAADAISDPVAACSGETFEAASCGVHTSALLQTASFHSKLLMDSADGLEVAADSRQAVQFYTVGADGNFATLADCIEHVKTNTPRHCRLLPGRHVAETVVIDGVDQLTIDGDLSQDTPPVLDGTEPVPGLQWTHLREGYVAADLQSLGGDIKIEDLLVGGRAIQCRSKDWATKDRPCLVFDPSTRWAKQFSYEDGVRMSTATVPAPAPANKLGVQCWANVRRTDPAYGVARAACGYHAGECANCGPQHACCKESEVEHAKTDTGGNRRRRRANKNAPECNSVVEWPRSINSWICVELPQDTTTTTTLPPSSLPPFWFNEDSQLLVVPDGDSTPEVRRLIRTRGVAIKITSSGTVRDLTLRGLQFLGTRFTSESPQYGDSYHLNVARCGFLYAPGSVDLITTRRSGRGRGRPISVTNSSFEFGRGAMFYKATNAVIIGNYFAFNSFDGGEAGTATVRNMAVRSRFEENTLLYNGDAGGHNQWGPGNVNRRNLIVGSNWLHHWVDWAVFHAVIPGQTDLQVIENWMLGPSNVKGVRLDTAKTTLMEGAGRYSTVRGNVFFGTDATTIKGVNHTVEHNTGDNLNIVSGWAMISGMNAHSYTRYNAVSSVSSRGAAALPGFAAANVCQDSEVCNPPTESWLSPAWLEEQLVARALDGSVCSELEACWATLPVTMGEGGQVVFVPNRRGLGEKRSHEVPLVPLEQIEGLDFRPKQNSKLVWEVPASSRLGGEDVPQTAADSFIEGYRDELLQPSTFDTFAGAYAPAPDGERWVPGCGGKPSSYLTLPLDAIRGL